MLESTQQNSEFPQPPARTAMQSVPPPTPATTQRTTTKSDQGGVALFSIEGIAMLIWAALLDLLGIVINLLFPGIGLLTTILGVCTVGIWSWFRGGKMPFSKKIKKFLKKGGTTVVLETVSVGVLPGWTILVILTCKK